MGNLVDIVIPEDVKEGSESLFGVWLKQVGEAVRQHEPIAEINTDKAAIEVCAPATGILKSTTISPDAPVKSGMVIGLISATEDVQESLNLKGREVNEQPNHPPSAPLFSKDVSGLRASPAVKRLAEKYSINLGTIKGTGRAGRIRKADIAHLLPGQAGIAAPDARKTGYRPQPIEAKSKKVPHDYMRKRIAQHMQYSLQTAPHVTAVFECDLSAVIEHRNSVREAFAKEDIQLTYTAYFVQAAVKAIQAVPEVNSTWHDDCLEVFEDCNIGVGTSLGEKGLVVPVVAQAQALSLKETAARLTQLVSKARDGKISPQELSNGTFSISNHGVSGSLVASPIIIHQPQSAILGVGKLERRTVVLEYDGKEVVEVRPMLYVTLTIDHRAVDAHQTNLFLTEFVSTLESWK
jgi:2-oxoglutarate dehydrogenase E2 component (dihydrolipoamide succinyltransferase)